MIFPLTKRNERTVIQKRASVSFMGIKFMRFFLNDGGETVKVAPSRRCVQSFELSSLKCRALISDFYSKFCGSQNGDEDSSITIGLSSDSEGLSVS
jgi:hypothetical protein